jgi:hypothetical protein
MISNFIILVTEIFTPYINLQITKGATRQEKSIIVKGNDRYTQYKTEYFHIVIEEITVKCCGFLKGTLAIGT